MEDQPGLSEQYRKASPWPLFVAVGLVLVEVGVVLGVVPLAVAGVLLFGGSVAGILREAGYVRTPWRPLAALGLLFVLLGAALWVAAIGPLTLGTVVAAPERDPVALRGASVVAAGVLLALAGVGGRLFTPLEAR